VGSAPRLDALIAGAARHFGVAAPPALQELVGQLNPARYVGAVVNGLQTFAGGAMYVMVYLGFLLASRHGFQRKVAALYPDASDREHAAAVFVRIRNGVERYLWIQTVTGLMIAILAWAAMAAVGQSHALFWGFLIFAVCYIPVVGGFLGGVLPPLFALVQFPSWWQAAVLFAWIQVVMFLVGSVVLPRMQRDSLNIDPVVVLLSLAFWGAIWGIPGMFLSTPLTVMAIIILAQFDGSRWIAILLSGDGRPEPDPVPTRPPRALPSPKPRARASRNREKPAPLENEG
jgi:predicted PurR-regulated permease PerM